MLGGWYNGRLPGHGATNEVWSSDDGLHWDSVTKAAGWSPRLAAGAVVFKGRIWILGGDRELLLRRREERQERRLELGRRQGMEAGGGRRPVVAPRLSRGGRPRRQDLDPRRRQLRPELSRPKRRLVLLRRGELGASHRERPWSPRLWFSSVVHRDRIWVLGGWSNNPSQNWGDVWYSQDGKNWTQLRSNVSWKERHEHSTYVFKDKIWVAGGHAKPLNSEVWSLEVPRPSSRRAVIEHVSCLRSPRRQDEL